MGAQIDSFADLYVSPAGCVLTMLGHGHTTIWLVGEIDLAVSAELADIALHATRVDQFLIDASRRLADEALPADELAALQQVVDSFVGEEVVGFHDLRARHVGSNHQVDLHLQFASGTSLERAHYVSHQLQHAIVQRLPGTTVLVHLEPEDRVRPDRFEQSDSVPSAS